MATGLVAVTGASGFLGRRLVPALAEAGWRVRVLVRRPTPRLWGAGEPDPVIGDVRDPASLATLLAGVDTVIHAAGLIKATDRGGFFAVNRDGSRQVAEAARSAGVERMLHISSLAAREPLISDYAASKRAGEDAAREVMGERLAVLRPPAIYGPGDRETLELFKLAAASPIMPMPASSTARLALAHVDEVVASLLAGAAGGWPSGVFANGGARPAGYGWREIFATAAAAMGRSPALAPVPGSLIRGAGAIVELIGRARGVPTIFNRGKARELLHEDWSVSPADEPPSAGAASIDLADGFAQTVAWYRAAGWLT